MSRAVATRASAQTGIGVDVLKKLLPIAAPGTGGDLFNMLTPMLDQNRDGSIVDDVLKNVGKMFGGR
jgi:hypothetical protein